MEKKKGWKGEAYAEIARLAFAKEVADRSLLYWRGHFYHLHGDGDWDIYPADLIWGTVSFAIEDNVLGVELSNASITGTIMCVREIFRVPSNCLPTPELCAYRRTEG